MKNNPYCQAKDQNQFVPDLPATSKQGTSWEVKKRKVVTSPVDNNPRHYLESADKNVDYADVNEKYNQTVSVPVVKKGFLGADADEVAPAYSEHPTDLFYADVEEDGTTGFLKRGNYLNRI